MTSVSDVVSAALPLVVALFNLLVAGHVLGVGVPARTRLVFGVGPAGVGLWAVAWFVSLLAPPAIDAMRVLGGIGGALAIGGFAVDALGHVDPRVRRGVVGAGILAILGLGLGLRALTRTEVTVEWASALSRIVAVVALAATAALRGWRIGPVEEQALGRRVLIALVACGVVYGALASYAWLGARTPVDPLLLIVLSAECLILVYVADRRFELRILLSRAVTYTLLALAVVLVAAVALRWAGQTVDLGLLAVTVAIALFAATLFVGLGEVLTVGVASVLFPERARLSRALDRSRAEVAVMRRRLERAERLALVGELAASVAHEIKNPLSPIRGYAQLLAGKLEQVDEAERALFERGLRIIRDEADRIDGRVQGLLGAARPAREGDGQAGRAELNRLVADVVAVAEGDAGRASIEVHLDPTIGWVAGAEDELRGALLNLLENALEAMLDTDGARVEVRSRRDGADAVIEVEDEGAGLEGAAEARAFEAFFTTKPTGTGLGMAIARSAVEAAGGTLVLTNRTDRRGALATLRVPLVEASPHD